MSRPRKTRSKPQSRLDYEKRMPTLTARVPKEIKDKLLVNLAKQGKSLTDALIALANDLDIEAKAYDEAWQDGYDEGLVEGHTLGESVFRVTYRCSVCGEPMAVETPEEREAAGQLMTEAGWQHIECPKRRRRR